MKISAHLIRHGPLAIFTLSEQGFYSGANFAANLMLARWMSASEFGTTTLVLSLSLSALLFYSSFLVEPMAVLGYANYTKSLPRYYRTLLLFHVIASLLFSVFCGLVSWIIPNPIARPILQLLAASIPFLMLIWLVRRLPYVEKRPRIAAEISALYAVILIGLLIATKAAGFLSTSTVVAVFCISSLVPALRILPLLRGGSWTEVVNYSWLKETCAAHWHFSRWLIIAAALNIPTINVQTAITSYFLGVEEVGIIRAVGIFIMPAQLFITSIGNLTITLLVRDFTDGNITAMARKAKRLTVLLAIGTVGYCCVVWAMSSFFDSLFFGGRYHDYLWLTPLLSLAPISIALGTTWNWTLRAAQVTHYVIKMTAIGAIFSVVGSFLLIPLFGLAGSAIASSLGPLACSVIASRTGRKWITEQHRNFNR